MITPDPDQTRRFLSFVLDPSVGCSEVRIFDAAVDRGNFVVAAQQFARTIAGWYDRPDALLADVSRVRGVSVYVTVNPITAALLARSDNRLLTRAKHTATDADAVCLRWLYLDIDPKRPADIGSTAGELAAALALRDAVLADHPELAASALWGCSGNGGWVLVRLPDYPNDADHRKILAGAIDGLRHRYNTADVAVDDKPKNPGRVMCLPGTIKYKGSNRPERPWRPVTLDGAGAPSFAALPPFDLAGWVGRHGPPPPPRPTPRPPRAAGVPTDRGSITLRAADYLARFDPAISGQGGHDQTFDAACALVKGFDLSVADALPILEAWNARCIPPWSARELEHKLADADAKPDDRPRGYLLVNNRARANTNGTGPDPGGLAAAFAAALPPDVDLPPGATAPPPNVRAVAAAADDAPCSPGSEANPHRLARLFLDQCHRHPDGPTLRFWREEFHAWDGTCYRVVPPKEIRAALADFISREFERLYLQALIQYGMRKARAAQDGAGPGRMPSLLPTSTRLIGDVIQALSGITLLTAQACPHQPAWLDRPSYWPECEILAARNSLVHLPTLADGEDDPSVPFAPPFSVPPTPAFFSSNALDYDFDSGAPEPAEWLTFLRSLWPDDQESIDTLQEWFGYLLTPDTSQQKILMLIGPKRSGRGTMARVLKALIGESNTTAPTLSGLATNFGLSPLIGRSVALIADARLGGRTDAQVIVERLLSISGEDPQTIDRKHLSAWNGHLTTRFVLVSNELPKLGDSSGALPGRMIALKLVNTFYGREDRTLTDRLIDELPSILLWAVEGWKRLRDRGRFVQPESSRELLEDLTDLSSPVGVFVAERCLVGPGYSVLVQELYDEWKYFCESTGRKPGDTNVFGKNLRAYIPALTTRQRGSDGARFREYLGVKVTRPYVPPDAAHDTNGAVF